MCFRKIDGHCRVMNEHHSLPAEKILRGEDSEEEELLQKAQSFVERIPAAGAEIESHAGDTRA